MTATTTPLPRSRLRARIVLAALSACGLAALARASFVQPVTHMVYNPSDSVPVGWYHITPAASPLRSLHVGSIVLVHLPPDSAALAAQRGYLPARIPLLKRVGAVAPQHVCMVNRELRIDGAPVATLLAADRMGRPLPPWQQCRPLADGELFLLSATNPASFDSRYFGPILASAVLGVARSIHLEQRP